MTLATARSAVERQWAGTPRTARLVIVSAAIFVCSFLGYYLSARWSGPWSLKFDGEPLDWYKHYIYLAEAMLHGTFDLSNTGMPGFYQDVVYVDGKIYLPYQPLPGVLAMPFVAIWGTSFHEWLLSMIVGSLNVVVFWHLLRALGVSRTTQVLLVPFFAFGTANFYSATTGTLWFYNHVVAVLFLQLAIICLLKRTPAVVPALFLGAAFLSRQASILAAPAFVYWMLRQRYPVVFSLETVRAVLRDRPALQQIIEFGTVLVPFVVIFFWYNAVRFGSITDTGLDEVYDSYAGVQYTFYLAQVPGATRFAEFDLRNAILHLYTIFLLPPTFVGGKAFFQPQTFGMSVILTSPALLYAAAVKRHDPLKIACWLALLLVPIPTLLYYSQGWVQYGYRYLMDYLPFLLILTAFGFDDNQSRASLRIKIALVVIACVAGFWGRYWGTQLSW